MIIGSAAPRSYEAGQTEAYMAAYALLGKSFRPLIVPFRTICHGGKLLDAYQNMYHTEAPRGNREHSKRKISSIMEMAVRGRATAPDQSAYGRRNMSEYIITLEKIRKAFLESQC